MSPSVLEALPPAVFAGLVLGVLFALVASGLFVVGERWFPSQQSSGAGRYTGEDRRRAEIRAYLQEIGERYAEDHPVLGQPVAFYLPERDVAVTFNAHAFFRIRNNTDTYAILCEHEMPGHHLGTRLPFDVPAVTGGLSPGDLQETIRAAFDALGLPTTASSDEIRSAYRERIKEVHPDHGGDEESFRRVQEAYATAREHAD